MPVQESRYSDSEFSLREGMLPSVQVEPPFRGARYEDRRRETVCRERGRSPTSSDAPVVLMRVDAGFGRVPVQFVGNWERDHRSFFLPVLEGVERRLRGLLPKNTARWVLVKNPSPSSAQFVAHRVGLSAIFQSRSPRALGRKIEAHFARRLRDPGAPSETNAPATDDPAASR